MALAVWELLCQLGEAGDLCGMVPPGGAAALEHQGRDRDLPAFVHPRLPARLGGGVRKA
jgi:hypothetical protein